MEHQHGFFDDPRTWVAVAFVIFVVLFGRTLWKALAAMLDKRAESVRNELAEAARLRREAESLLADATSRREAAISEAAQLLNDARAEAERVAAATAEETRASATRRQQMALDRISAAEKQAVTDVRLAAVDVAAAAAGQLIRSGFGPEDDAAFLDYAIAGLPNALTRRTV